MKLELHPDAEAELLEAAVWYDEQLLGLGDDLLLEMARWLDVVAESPLAWPRWPGPGGRRLPSSIRRSAGS